MISPELRAAYLATTYRAWIAGEEIDIRVGCETLRLDFLLGGKSWAFLSAENPGSVLTLEENPERHRKLVEKLGAAQCEYYPGEGIPDGSWPSEQSVLIAGIDENKAVRLGREFGQKAVLCGDGSGVARLVCCEQ